MRGFRRVAGTYVAGLDGAEREVLATVAADVAELLGAGRFGTDPRPAVAGEAERVANPLIGLKLSAVAVPAPIDPAVHRLLPDASDDDPELAAEFRRLTESDLRTLKVDRLRRLWELLEAASESDDAAESDDAVGPDDAAGPDDAEADDAAERGPGADLVVAVADAAELAATLTDLRLVLADRLGVESEEDSDALYEALDRRDLGLEASDADDPDRPGRDVLADEIREYLASVYAALSWLQESLLAVMLADLP